MKKMINDLPVFSTSDLQIAAFLKTNRMSLLEVQRDQSGRCQFVFRDDAEREKLLMDYANDGMIPVRSLLSAIRDLKGLANMRIKDFPN